MNFPVLFDLPYAGCESASRRGSEATLPTRRSSEAVPPRTDMTSMRVVFVDDEAANCRLGLRMLPRLGLQRDNITFLTNGALPTPPLPSADRSP